MNKRYRSCLLVGLCLLLMFFSKACAGSEISSGIREISKYGNVVLSMKGSDFLAEGYAFGDIVRVDIDGQHHDMPVGSSYSDVDDGKMICRVEIDESAGEDRLVLAINMGDFASQTGLAVKKAIQEEPGYRWEYTSEEVISIFMKEPGGYANEYNLRQLVRTNAKTDYPHLTDEEFANFREIRTTGMGRGMLYRASSPIDPQLGRSAYADAALKAAGVRTVMNLADTMQEARTYPGFDASAYAACDVIALNLSLDVKGKEFEEGFARGLRFLMEHSGPYLVHCTEGKDRAGFVSAVLACLMGAPAQEVLEDYMTTYENYYGTQPESESYQILAESNMKKTLEEVFGVEDLLAEDIDSSQEAEEYCLQRLKLAPEEIDLLRKRLSGKE